MRHEMPRYIIISAGMTGYGNHRCVFMQVKGADESNGRL